MLKKITGYLSCLKDTHLLVGGLHAVTRTVIENYPYTLLQCFHIQNSEENIKIFKIFRKEKIVDNKGTKVPVGRTYRNLAPKLTILFIVQENYANIYLGRWGPKEVIS